ncbi:MAG: HAD family hydrolase, partial [Candidatus Adiutrix sp.]
MLTSPSTFAFGFNQFQGICLLDFDGTIKPPDGRAVAHKDKEILKKMGANGWLRVVATGRSLFSFAAFWEADLEIDALIFSSGAGACFWNKSGPTEMLFAKTMTRELSYKVAQGAKSLDYGFFAYESPPDSHHFYYFRPKGRVAPAGFDLRL